MKKIICPECGEVSAYGVTETVKRMLCFDAEGNGNGCTEDVCVYGGKARRCLRCLRKVRVIIAK